jgi:hypothetical protein
MTMSVVRDRQGEVYGIPPSRIRAILTALRNLVQADSR